MTVERHYDDEALISLLETGRDQSDAHLPSCTVCREKLDSFSMVAGVLHDHDVWDTRTLHLDPVPATITNLRAFADRMTAEDTAAAAILPELLAGPREEWMPRLREHPEWRTAGVVRGLIAATIPVQMTMPPDALEMSVLSTEIADSLDPAAYPSDAVARLRGTAWRDRTYALYYVGRYNEALAAADRADAILRACVVDEYERARVAMVRALALRVTEDIPAAMAAVRFSRDTFTRFDDVMRIASAGLAETHLLLSRSDFQSALTLLQSLEIRMSRTTDANTHARVLSNMGYCLWKLGRVDDALHYHAASAQLFEDLGIDTEQVRARWNIASILASAGRLDEARARFEILRSEFAALGMTSEQTLVSLDIAELMLAREEFIGVEVICRAAMHCFETAGLSYSARALTALAYIREAAQHKTITPVQVRHVREYLKRLPHDGELLFAPLPDDVRRQNAGRDMTSSVTP
ncbi:MAG TPA: tetratricopeptide repeat protein [Thermoanaerobaculia bacterium]